MREKENEIKLLPMDRFILRLFPYAEIYPDGVVCNFDLLKLKTIEIIKNRFNIEENINCYFNLDNVEYWGSDRNNIKFVDYGTLLLDIVLNDKMREVRKIRKEK